MLSLGEVTLRPLEPDDIDQLYSWESDSELNILAGWSPLRSRAAFRQVHEQRIMHPPDDLVTLGIQVGERLVGYVQLAQIEREERRAAVGILIGDKQAWGRGIGSAALRILLDYAFTIEELERVYAETYSFNTRSFRLMERVGFQLEGTMRQHEIHNGIRQDMHLFGMLKSEFYQRYPTIFRLPDENENLAEKTL
ncbi:MAG: GNAT family N-acetyltransferase [Ktedonobacteraceae bacterium]|nr:GNAT family N-acetyltransferase [Ktedonobacteraceae bacterium]